MWEQAWGRWRDGFTQAGVVPQQKDEGRKGQGSYGFMQGCDDIVIITVMAWLLANEGSDGMSRRS